eukprot:TRINITY_DN5527_c0_g2_i1.p1 TRINITY_DN5527_c0_g2~~TRINITY_DN5527_c0_g2_i1.p1  ORF type:complete len:509 (-),score=62.26 TRINITY_DN5527_c0_g2_i1:494-2020(-)
MGNSCCEQKRSALEATQGMTQDQISEILQSLVDKRYFTTEQYDRIYSALEESNKLLSVVKDLMENFVNSKLLGQGAFAKVVKGQSKKDNKYYALKITDRKQNMELMAQYRDIVKEVAILILLSKHEHVVRLIDAFQDLLRWYVVMELCEGGELFDMIVQVGTFTEANALDVAGQLLDFAQYCHALGIVHRDLKPENILLKNKCENLEDVSYSTKIIDFGTSDFCGNGQRLSMKFGTPYYVAPEVLKKDYDTSIDIWSIGVILYIMLCGYPPFGGKTDEQIISRVIKGQPCFSGPEWKLVSAQTIDLVQKFLQPAEQRWDAAQLLNHPAFKNISSKKQSSLGQHMIQRLQSFEKMTRLKKISLVLLVQSLTDKEVQTLRARFKESDRDNDGKVSAEELRECFQKVNSSVKEEEWQHIFDICDKNTEGLVDYHEFIAAMLDRDRMARRKGVLRKSFEMMDNDNDGFIDAQDLVQATRQGLSIEEATVLLGEVADEEGKIDYSQYYELLSS